MKLRKAVLLIHGFAGGTYDMESLAWHLEKSALLDVYQFTLPGHAQKKSCVYKDWVAATEEKIENLIESGYKSIYVVGHSMGGVLAAYAATKYPEVKKVVFAAAAFKYIGEWENFSIKKTGSIINEYGLHEIAFRFFERLSLKAVNEFVLLVKKYQNLPENIDIPVLIIQGLKDDVVPVTSAEYIFDNVRSKIKGIVYLEQSNHDMFNGVQQDIINEKILKFLKHNTIVSEKENI